MEFGKLCSWEKQGNRVVFQFEKRTGRVEILTPEIFNVFSGVVSEEHRSKAIEGDKSVAVDFTAAEADGVVEISTDAVTARIYDDFKVDFYKADGTVLCRDYRGSRKICAISNNNNCTKSKVSSTFNNFSNSIYGNYFFF